MTVGSVSIRVHPAGAALALAAFFFAPSQWVLAVLAALVWHEAAHLLALMGCGARAVSVELTPFGGMMDAASFDRLPPVRQAVCAAAGVLGSALAAAICVAAAPRTPFWSSFWAANASLALVNCLPAWPLDGARALEALARAVGIERGVRRVLRAFSVALGLGMLLVALWGAWQGAFNLSLLLAGPYLWYASSQSRVSERVRGLGRNESKLTQTPVCPARLMVTRFRTPPGMLAGRLAEGRYNLLVSVDAQGNVRRLWTEDEIRAHFLQMEGIGERES